MKNLVDTAIDAGTFTKLVQAIQAAGLVEALSGPGPYTVFAPNDDAFAILPAGTLDSLLNDIPKLKDILMYHVLEGKFNAADVMKMTSAKTLQGQAVSINAKDGVQVNEATVIKPDIETENGVIHVIDRVIMPR
jgi:uncharacterized surface protein with fasciclin (FAS1) repeats